MNLVKNVSPTNDATLSREAAIFGAYVIHATPHQDAIDLYIKALQKNPGAPSQADQKRLDFVRRHPWALRLIDPGLAVVDPSSEVRRRIYVMFSILEAAPHYHTYFLPQNRTRWYFLVIGIKGAWGLVKSVLGAALVKVIS